MITPEALLSQIKEGKIKPIYLFIGEDGYAKESLVRALKEYLSKRSQGKLVYESVIASEEDPNSVVTTMYRNTLFGGSTFVVVRNFESVSKAGLKTYMKYFKKPNKNNLMVLLSEKKEPKSIKEEIISSLEENGEIVFFPKPSLIQINSWIKSLFKKNGFDITEGLCHKFVEMVGEDRFILESEIEKVCLYFKEKSVITEEDLNQYASYTKVYSSFELVDAFFERDYQKILRLTENLYEADKDMPLKVIGALNRQVQFLLVYKDMVANKVPRSKILSELVQGKEFILRKVESQAKKWEFVELRDLLTYLKKLDGDIKQGMPVKTSLASLIFFTKTKLQL